MGFFYSFTETLLHSIWQTGVLLLMYSSFIALVPNVHPLQKRNALYSILAFQIILSFITFWLFANNITVFAVGSIIRSGYTGLISEYGLYIFIAWFIVAISRAFILMKHWFGFKKKLATSFIKPNTDLKIFTEMRRLHLGIKRHVSLWYSKNITTPVTYGFFKPVILLPFSLVNNISIAEAESIILHELAHIKNKDYLLNWLLAAAEIIYFFNPFISMISKRIKLEREKNCDVQVMQFEYPAINYAQLLLRIAKQRSELKSFQMAAARGPEQLLQRIRFFSVDENLSFNRIRGGAIALPAALMLLLATVFFLPNAVQQFPAKMLASNFNIPVNFEGNKNFTTASIAENAFANQDEVLNNFYSQPQTANPKPYQPQKFKENYVTENRNAESNAQFFTDPNITMIPVVMQDTPDSVKEFTYRIETQKGTITQTYKLTLIKGEWVFEPMWMITERVNDSLNRVSVIDSIQ